MLPQLVAVVAVVLEVVEVEDVEDSTFVEQLRSNIGKAVSLHVYNSRTELIRDVILVPSNMWGGKGFLGVVIRFCSVEKATQNVWHVL
eukprot:Awhi_evm1s6041